MSTGKDYAMGGHNDNRSVTIADVSPNMNLCPKEWRRQIKRRHSFLSMFHRIELELQPLHHAAHKHALKDDEENQHGGRGQQMGRGFGTITGKLAIF